MELIVNDQAEKIDELNAQVKELKDLQSKNEERQQDMIQRIRYKMIEPLVDTLRKNRIDFMAIMKKMQEEVPSDAIKKLFSSGHMVKKTSFHKNGVSVI